MGKKACFLQVQPSGKISCEIISPLLLAPPFPVLRRDPASTDIRDEPGPSDPQIPSLSAFSVEVPCPPAGPPPGWTRENPPKMSTKTPIRRYSDAMTKPGNDTGFRDSSSAVSRKENARKRHRQHGTGKVAGFFGNSLRRISPVRKICRCLPGTPFNSSRRDPVSTDSWAYHRSPPGHPNPRVPSLSGSPGEATRSPVFPAPVWTHEKQRKMSTRTIIRRYWNAVTKPGNYPRSRDSSSAVFRKENARKRHQQSGT